MEIVLAESGMKPAEEDCVCSQGCTTLITAILGGIEETRNKQ
jgi:hypothetical protein